MKDVHVLDVLVEAAFGLAAGCALYFFLAADGHPAEPLGPYVGIGMGIGLLQAAVDLLRGRGWSYSLACASALGFGIFIGGRVTLIGAVLYRTVVR